MDFSKIYQSKGLKPKNKGHTNFYEHCDLTKKSISSAHDLMVIHIMIDQQGKYVLVDIQFLFNYFSYKVLHEAALNIN